MFKPIVKYVISPNVTGVITLLGNSANIFPKKYALTEYILLFASLKKTGLSSGKMRTTF